MSDDERLRRVDDLLKKVLADDVPAAVGRRMETVLRRARETRGRGAEVKKARDGAASRTFRLGLDWRWARRALAFASFLLVVLGGTLHLAGPRSALADSLFNLNTLTTVSRQLRRAGAMDASVRAQGPDGLPLDCEIAWRAAGDSRLDVRSGGRVIKVLSASAAGVVVEDRVTGLRTERPGWEDVRDPVLEPILWLATPGSIADRIDARWIPRSGGGPGVGAPTAILLADPGSGESVRLFLDPGTLRPVAIVIGRAATPGPEAAGDVVLSARLTWSDPRTRRE